MIITMNNNPLTLIGDELNIGDTAPNFKAIKSDLSEFNLSEIENKTIVITSFPSIDTGICAIQTTKFNHKVADFGDDVVLIIISNDLPFALNRYCGINNINNAIILSDHRDVDFSMKYGVLIKELRLLGRTVFVIDKNKKLVYKEIASEIKTELDYDKAFEAVKNSINN